MTNLIYISPSCFSSNHSHTHSHIDIGVIVMLAGATSISLTNGGETETMGGRGGEGMVGIGLSHITVVKQIKGPPALDITARLSGLVWTCFISADELVACPELSALGIFVSILPCTFVGDLPSIYDKIFLNFNSKQSFHVLFAEKSSEKEVTKARPSSELSINLRVCLIQYRKILRSKNLQMVGAAWLLGCSVAH